MMAVQVVGQQLAQGGVVVNDQDFDQVFSIGSSLRDWTAAGKSQK
ncbi:hypothetical protein [Neopusillimonas aromaticivorans]|nr:hypothetical protein [Neopusillimonas aromaticivorans]WJJ92980.1 hypothetical protein N7E01_12540 [Neopusillimonas aromaticivorans]